MTKKTLNEFTKALLWTGGLNLGVLGLLDYNILYQVFKPWPIILKLVYILIGLAAVRSIAEHEL